jgi:hypothetical protein
MKVNQWNGISKLEVENEVEKMMTLKEVPTKNILSRNL